MSASHGSCYAALTPHIIYRPILQHGRLAVYNTANETVTLHWYQHHAREMDLLISLASARADKQFRYGFFSDREVFVLASKDGLQLWFFNPDFVPDLPGAEPF